ncbi:sensor domain-containing diguanylate cyclase [Clostridium sp.]|jgi:diguanylate cyclase (GGDEF)-like protein|uniref:sensor domain-containing diguanylate cyclase n=1 Tax=Clostridium sp. TaxID=1506 RepID=UPI003EEAF002
MNKKLLLIVTFILVLIPQIMGVVFSNKSTNPKPPKPVDGFLDLSNWSFEDNGIIRLDGQWSFYFNQFITHQDFEKGVDVLPTPIAVPSTRKNMELSKPIAENKFYGTMRLVVKLPDKTKAYGLRTDIVLTSFKLFIDGKLAGEVGEIGTTEKNSVPFYKLLSTYFNPQSNEVELIYNTSDFHAGDCSIVAPRLGLANQISKEGQMGLGRDLFLFGMLLIMGIYHLGIYIMRRKDWAPLYFSIFCLLFALRMLMVGERFLPSIFGIDFFIYGRTAYFCVFVGFAALCGFLYYALKGLFAKWFIKVSVSLGVIFGLLVLLVPYSIFDKLLIIYAIFGFALITYAIVRLLVGVLKCYPFASIVLLGFACLAVTFVNDLIYQVTLANKTSLIPLGVAIFTFTQAYTLSAKFSNALTRAEQLSLDKQSILSELKHVNINLESIVDERTADLQNALEEMEIMSKTDYLTKLPNRRLMLEKTDQLIEQNKDFFIALVDIDHFKDVNDTYGHERGDEVLKKISTVMNSAVGNDGIVGRWGGEEFLIVLMNGQPETILKKANAISQAVADCRYEGIDKNITITIGLCRYSEQYSMKGTIANADKALYQGKINGRNQCKFFRS